MTINFRDWQKRLYEEAKCPECHKPMSKCGCDMEEELKGNQHKLDKNKNGKLDAQDFKMLRKEDIEQMTEQQIDEVLSKDSSAGDWIHDFVHSDNPKFAGKSKEQRKKQALAAYYAKQRNEEVEGLDEISSNLAARAAAVARAKRQNSFERGNAVAAKAHNDQANRLQVGSDNRSTKETNKAYSDALKKSRKRIQQSPLSDVKKRRMGEEVESIQEGGEKYKVKSTGRDAKGDYYVSPSTGKNVYKSGVEKGDHEVPGTGEIKKKMAPPKQDMKEANINDTMHPAGAALLKHIKPEHHNLYKPHLTKDTFNGSYKDRTDVLNAAKKAGHMKEEAKITYREFIEYINEMEYKNGRYVHKGTYGTSYQGDDEDDEDKPKKKAEPTGEKRGRGRPMGSKSGARQSGAAGKSYGGLAFHSLNLPNSNK